jgi:hypothetical protein
MIPGFEKFGSAYKRLEQIQSSENCWIIIHKHSGNILYSGEEKAIKGMLTNQLIKQGYICRKENERT